MGQGVCAVFPSVGNEHEKVATRTWHTRSEGGPAVPGHLFVCWGVEGSRLCKCYWEKGSE